MEEIEKEIEEFKKKFTFILLDRTDKDNGKRIMKPESRGASCDEIKTFLSQALLRTEKRVREERDKEILEWAEKESLSPTAFAEDAEVIEISKLEDFINKNHE